VSPRELVAEADRRRARVVALSLLAAERVDDLLTAMSAFQVKGDLFPGDVLIDMAADALAVAAPTRERPILASGIRERFLPELEFAGNTEQQKSWTALKVAAMTYAGVQPNLLEEAGWWRVNDLWYFASTALVIYVRASAEHAGISVREVCERIALTHDLELELDDRERPDG
jgi:hypothetical protein